MPAGGIAIRRVCLLVGWFVGSFVRCCVRYCIRSLVRWPVLRNFGGMMK